MLVSTAAAQSPDPEKPAFRALVPAGAVVEKLLGDFQFTEGPLWNASHGYLIFSDIPASRLYRYDPATRKAEIFREPTGNGNGNCYDAAGALYTCEQGGRKVSVQAAEGGPVTVLAERYEGKLLSSPNDIVCKRDGTLWFTDPPYGLEHRPKEQATNNVYRFDPKTRDLHLASSEVDEPNGLCFSPDETHLYVADSGHPRQIDVFDVGQDNQLSNRQVFCRIDRGVPDGIRCDRHGNVFSTSAAGIQIFSPAGERLGLIPVPETPANLCFGGPNRDELYITAHTSLYHVKVTTEGAP